MSSRFGSSTFPAENMESNKLVRFMAIVLVFMPILVACGAGGPKLGDFPDISKTEGDPPFFLTAPTSAGPGAFSYSSSNTAVATISESTVTIVGVGSTTITATQAAVGSFNSSSTTATLRVNPRVCTAPARSQNGVCVPPTTTGNSVMRGSRAWMPVSFADTWTNANTYCTTTTINGETGWRLPTVFELSDLYTSGVMNEKGWLLSKTWSSTEVTTQTSTTTTAANTTSTTTSATTTTTNTTTTTTNLTTRSMRKTLNLSDGVIVDEFETNGAYVACLR